MKNPRLPSGPPAHRTCESALLLNLPLLICKKEVWGKGCACIHTFCMCDCVCMHMHPFVCVPAYARAQTCINLYERGEGQKGGQGQR